MVCSTLLRLKISCRNVPLNVTCHKRPKSSIPARVSTGKGDLWRKEIDLYTDGLVSDCGISNALARNTLMGDFFKFSSFTTFYVITIPMYWEIPEDEPSNHGAWNRNQIQHLLCFILFGRLLNESTILFLTRITRTTRTPAFWDTPRPMITHTRDSYQIQSQNKTKSKLQI